MTIPKLLCPSYGKGYILAAESSAEGPKVVQIENSKKISSKKCYEAHQIDQQNVLKMYVWGPRITYFFKGQKW